MQSKHSLKGQRERKLRGVITAPAVSGGASVPCALGARRSGAASARLSWRVDPNTQKDFQRAVILNTYYIVKCKIHLNVRINRPYKKKTNLCKEVTTSECYALGPAKGSKRHVHSPVAGGGGSRGRLRGALITAAHYHVPPPAQLPSHVPPLAQLPSQPRPPRTEGTLTNTPGNPGG